MVERRASGSKTPNEIALDILLAALTIVFLLATVTLLPFSLYSVESAQARASPVDDHRAGRAARLPDPDDDRRRCCPRSASPAWAACCGANVIATSGRAVEAAGDVDVLLLDKTGTITLGNRQATAFLPGARRQRRAISPTPRSSPRSPTRRPKAAASSCSRKRSYGLRERDVPSSARTFVPFSAQTRMSGVDIDGRADPQGRGRRDRALRRSSTAATLAADVASAVEDVARRGSTPLVVADGEQRARRRSN